MEKGKFSVTINAPASKVWQVLWGDDTYPKWTAAFSEGSHAETDWQEGSKVRFLGPNNEGGMYSTIARAVPNEYMSFKHLGVIKNGVELPQDAETEKWSGSMENYTLTEIDGTTELSVDIDIVEEYKDFFMTAFPKALGLVKELAEG